VNCKDDGESPKRKCADDPIPKCPLLERLGERVRQDGKDNGVVGTEDPFKENEGKDDQDVVIVDGLPLSRMLEKPLCYELPRPSVAVSKPELNPLGPPSL
jgi:hypothetical protein